MSKVMKCNCAHRYQDRTHGEGCRVHNQTASQGGKVFRCTVCSTERSK